MLLGPVRRTPSGLRMRGRGRETEEASLLRRRGVVKASGPRAEGRRSSPCKCPARCCRQESLLPRRFLRPQRSRRQRRRCSPSGIRRRPTGQRRQDPPEGLPEGWRCTEHARRTCREEKGAEEASTYSKGSSNPEPATSCLKIFRLSRGFNYVSKCVSLTHIVSGRLKMSINEARSKNNFTAVGLS